MADKNFLPDVKEGNDPLPPTRVQRTTRSEVDPITRNDTGFFLTHKLADKMPNRVRPGKWPDRGAGRKG